MMTDPIADLLTRIRNASRARKETLEAPWSRLKESLATVLANEGYLAEVSTAEEGPHKVLRIRLRYDEYQRPIITGLRRESRPSRRWYVGSDAIPQVRRGLGVTVLSTPKGVLADRDARQQKVGGEVLCSVW